MRVQNAPRTPRIFSYTAYNATKRPLVAAYPEGYSVKADRFVGVALLPAPRYDRLADVVDCYGERVEDPDELLPALRRGLARVRAGQSFVIDVAIG